MSRPRALKSPGAYPMRSAVKLTGLPAETVRAWERRYGAVEPLRTAGSARRYRESDVARLRLLRRVTEAGFAIGSVAKLSSEALERMLMHAQPQPQGTPLEAMHQRYMEALQRFDAQGMQALLAQASVAFPPRSLVLDLLAPIMRSIGEGWRKQEVTIAMEHLATHQIRALLDGMTRAVPLPPHAPRIVLATSEGQLHDLGLSMAALLAVQRGIEPVLIGANVPFADLSRILDETHAEVLVLAYTGDMEPNAARRARTHLRALAKKKTLWLAASAAHPLATLRDEVQWLTDFAAFEDALTVRFPTE